MWWAFTQRHPFFEIAVLGQGPRIDIPYHAGVRLDRLEIACRVGTSIELLVRTATTMLYKMQTKQKWFVQFRTENVQTGRGSTSQFEIGDG